MTPASGAGATIDGVRRLVAWVRRQLAPFVERLVEVELFDRAVAIASQAFVALIPYMVVVSALFFTELLGWRRATVAMALWGLHAASFFGLGDTECGGNTKALRRMSATDTRSIERTGAPEPPTPAKSGRP